MFRLMLLLSRAGEKWIEGDKLRIMDFYLLFPREITTIRLPQLFQREKLQFQKFPQYETITNPASVFCQLDTIFANTVTSLLSFGVIEQKPGDRSAFRVVSGRIPGAIRDRLGAKELELAPVLDFLFAHILPFPLYGKDGLKDRTHLLPSRYDRR